MGAVGDTGAKHTGGLPALHVQSRPQVVFRKLYALFVLAICSMASFIISGFIIFRAVVSLPRAEGRPTQYYLFSAIVALL